MIRDRVINKRTSVLIYDALGDADLRFRESIVSQASAASWRSRCRPRIGSSA